MRQRDERSFRAIKARDEWSYLRVEVSTIDISASLASCWLAGSLVSYARGHRLVPFRSAIVIYPLTTPVVSHGVHSYSGGRQGIAQNQKMT
ncbi:hypothetical protein DM860_012397 [Cuscuta australis]|uniref:Uncharacterized protein n=1 Tax=Cuscuta australis TaxID=267555 RepID=A0A328DQ41_9ASTE|nr:hypothetical protein DM860_012397 [Cuscuta australis]